MNAASKGGGQGNDKRLINAHHQDKKQKPVESNDLLIAQNAENDEKIPSAQ
ncbi:hypothetical protein [Lysinibacillus sp. 3P01SB]|uniref:hypothetical protein n=1 Tax=Lysinibacillus sp. 3P01SB TaxID=3132284 RepID=UPI0039A52E27